MKHVAIYLLVNKTIPGHPLPFYVGQTVEPRRRLAQHVSRSCHSRLLARRIENCIRMSGELPEMDVLEWCTPDDAGRREEFWIRELVAHGFAPANAGPWNTPTVVALIDQGEI